LYFWGSYEEEYCARWIKLACSSNIVFDLGANAGLYSLCAATMNPNSQVHAFEPTRGVFELLEKNIRLNNLNNIHANALAVGRARGTAVLRICRGSDGTNEGMNFISDDVAEGNPSDVPVSVVSLDEYCQQRGIGHIDLAKMDIEGGEYAALLGAADLLGRRAIRCLFVELAEWAANRAGHSTRDIKQLLYSSRYRLYELDSGRLAEVRPETIHHGQNIIALAPGFEVHAF